MIFSKTVSYALRAIIFLAEHRGEGPVLSSVIAREETIPAPFLSKILGTMTIGGLVGSLRGPKGGFILKKDPDDIRLIDVLSLFGYKGFDNYCVLGYETCHENHSCPMHLRWENTQKAFSEFVENTSISEIRRDLPAQFRNIVKRKKK